ncbi:hypothetical protein A2U01_0029462, partial [Trifolium medium]|nr:hypothetical protein [Trifolium medium]
MKPVTITAPNLIPNSSGIRLELVIERFESVNNSIQNGFAYAGTIDDKEDGVAFGFGFGFEFEFVVAVVAPETNFPREMLALIASFNDNEDVVLCDASE